jgi:hypothetical protein
LEKNYFFDDQRYGLVWEGQNFFFLDGGDKFSSDVLPLEVQENLGVGVGFWAWDLV